MMLRIKVGVHPTLTDLNGKKDRNCIYHGPNTHPSSSCKVLKVLSDSAKKSRNTTTGNDKTNKNKTWSRKAEDAKAVAKKEVNTYVKKAVEKQLKANSKKRPVKTDDDDKSLNVIENTIDLSGIDFHEELNHGIIGLSIDSDESSDVSV
jgi:hypothetical protein